MTLKIFGAFKRIHNVRVPFINRSRSGPPKEEFKMPPETPLFHDNVIKLATVRLMPNLRLLSFRVSKNFLYFSFARPDTDLLEFYELCSES